MNLMERNTHTEENGWREDIKSELHTEQDGQEEMPAADSDQETDGGEQGQGGLAGMLQQPFMTPVLLGVIVALLLCIVVLLFVMPGRRKAQSAGAGNGELQQSITQYAQEQKQNDYVSGLSGDTVAVEPAKDKTAEEDEPEVEPASDVSPVSADGDKAAIVVDVEDESDVSYSKEFILNEALPYFADNNQDAIWDLAHLKRYVKLSEQLENTNRYYYQGDVNSDGKPHGQGLAIYENNSYYYGDWSDGVRSGNGTWYRFYIGKKNKSNAMGKYIAHSYAGAWADDLPEGAGAEHFEVDIPKLQVRERILQNVVGNFAAGLYDGELYANTVDYTGNVEEWSGVAQKGVFSLWRDMSAIGECSVWRKNDDHSLCMDIDKSENKNQGIRELLKPDTK